MSLPKSPLAYADCQEFLDLAMGDAQGARRFIGADYQPASYFRFRCLNYRVLDREANARLYPEGHKMHGMSIYDNLYLTIEQDTENNFGSMRRSASFPPAKSKLYRRQTMGTKRPAAFYAPLWGRAKAEEIGIAIDIAPDDRVNFINTLYEYRKTGRSRVAGIHRLLPKAGPHLHRA